MDQTLKSIADELHSAADMLTVVRKIYLKHGLISEGVSYDRQVVSLISKGHVEGDKRLVEFVRKTP